MADPLPTPAQAAVLEVLSEYWAVTARELWSYLPAPAGDRARRALLLRLQRRGWITSAALRPERGAASERYWQVTAAGYQVLGVPPPATPPPAPATIRSWLAPEAPPLGALPAPQGAILGLLAEWKQLTTTQIWAHLHPDKGRDYTRHLLQALVRARCIRGCAVDPTRGGAAEHYWGLRAHGAEALGLAYDTHYRRRPTAAMLHYRGVQLTLVRAVEAAGWTLFRPAHYNSRHPRPTPTPQYTLLEAAVLTLERRAVDAALARGVPAAALGLRLDQLRIGSTGAIIPAGVNDFVAHVPGHPELTVLLILPPPSAGPAFWVRTPVPEAARQLAYHPREPRTRRYRRLAAILPVIGVFETAAAVTMYAPLLAPAGLEALAIDAIGARLQRQAPAAAPPPAVPT